MKSTSIFRVPLLLLVSVTVSTRSVSGSAPLSTDVVGTSYARLAEFADELATASVADDPAALAVHSSGGAAGGVVSEGQGYGLLIAGGTLAAMDTDSADRAEALRLFYGFFLGWRRMCELSADAASCQQDEGFLCGGGQFPCLPHWKFDNDLSGAVETGAAPDGDEDALVGMILGVLAVQADSSPPAWYDEVAEWAYDTCMQFYLSNTVDSPTGSHRIVKLGSCWGGWDGEGQNPSYHAPGAYRICRDYMAAHDVSFGASATEGDEMEADWNRVIDTSYKMFAADQCAETGLITNWAEVSESADGTSLTAITGMSGSGTPAAEYGSEAARGVWRVALDYLLYPAEAGIAAAAFLSPVVAHVERKEADGTFADELDVPTGCLVNAVHSDWQWNAFLAGPTFASLVCPASGVESSRQEAVLETAGHRIASFSISEYYGGSWIAISTMTLNGDLATAGALVRALRDGESPTAAPTAAPTAVVPDDDDDCIEVDDDDDDDGIGDGGDDDDGNDGDDNGTVASTGAYCCTWGPNYDECGATTDYCGSGEDQCGECEGRWLRLGRRRARKRRCSSAATNDDDGSSSKSSGGSGVGTAVVIGVVCGLLVGVAAAGVVVYFGMRRNHAAAADLEKGPDAAGKFYPHAPPMQGVRSRDPSVEQLYPQRGSASAAGYYRAEVASPTFMTQLSTGSDTARPGYHLASAGSPVRTSLPHQLGGHRSSQV